MSSIIAKYRLRSPAAILLLIGVLSAGVNPAGAQTAWYPLDDFPPGTPPGIILTGNSDLQHTVLDVTIHGFYYQSITVGGQIFRRVSLSTEPEPDPYLQVGRPELPMLEHILGCPIATSVGTPTVQVLAETSIPGARIFPHQAPYMDHGGYATPPAFSWDQAFYQQTTQPCPSARAAAGGHLGRFSGLELFSARSCPFRAVPASQLLLVARHYVVSIPHPGGGSPAIMQISRRLQGQYQRLLANYLVVAPFRPVGIGWAGDYLIITAPEFLEEIQPLADQKEDRGYTVTVATTDVAGSICWQVIDYIHDWWAAGDPGRDHYVLLVGDTNDLSTCTDGDGNVSDRIYSCIDGTDDDGPDPFPEVRLGRLPCDTESECSAMVEKILDYESGPLVDCEWLERALLVAHKGEVVYNWLGEAVELGTYEDNQILVSEWPTNLDPPEYAILSGASGHTNFDVRTWLDDGQGILSYRGWGRPERWPGWSAWDEDFDAAQLSLLDLGEKTPVVLSLTADNNRISNNSPDCLGEQWMKDASRAVAHYGATDTTDTGDNDWLNIRIFNYLSEGVTILGEMITSAENEIITYDGAEPTVWQYLLLGDPELKIWRLCPEAMRVDGMPGQLPPGESLVQLAVRHLSTGQPVPGALVVLRKEGEFSASGYTNTQGQIALTVHPQTVGEIRLTAYTESGNEGVVQELVPVVDPASSVPGSGGGEILTLSLAPLEPSPARSLASLDYVLPAEGRARLAVLDVLGREVAVLVDRVLPAGRHRAAWSERVAGSNDLPAGVYFARLEFTGEVRTRRIVVVP